MPKLKVKNQQEVTQSLHPFIVKLVWWLTPAIYLSLQELYVSFQIVILMTNKKVNFIIIIQIQKPNKQMIRKIIKAFILKCFVAISIQNNVSYKVCCVTALPICICILYCMMSILYKRLYCVMIYVIYLLGTYVTILCN